MVLTCFRKLFLCFWTKTNKCDRGVCGRRMFYDPWPPNTSENYFRALRGATSRAPFDWRMDGACHFLYLKWKKYKTIIYPWFNLDFNVFFLFVFYKLFEWLNTKNVTIPLHKFGVFMQNKEISFLCNNMLIVARFYIQKCRFVSVSSCFEAFKNDYRIVFQSIKQLKITLYC